MLIVKNAIMIKIIINDTFSFQTNNNLRQNNT